MNLIWFIIRGSGFAAFALLTASVVWGLLVSTKTLGRTVKPKGLTGLHESLGIAAVVATVVHLVAVTMDDFIGFSWSDALVPGASEWEPIAVSLGVVAFWMMLVVTASFYVKKWIGPVLWKIVHRMSVGVFVSALAHGLLAGTDTTNPWVAGAYAGSLAAVVLLTVVRMLTSRQVGQKQTRASRPQIRTDSEAQPPAKPDPAPTM